MLKISRKRNAPNRKITFVLPADSPPTSVVGPFNNWDPYMHPLRKRSNGTRSVSITVPADQPVEFRYLSDGDQWRNDPDATINGNGNSELPADT